MTDKQIIIDGCDVSGCEFYSYIESNKYPHRCTCYEDMYGASVVCDLADCCKNCHYKNWKRKEQECEELKKYLNQIRDEELSHLDIEWDEYETSARQEDYSNIITLVERALGEIDD